MPRPVLLLALTLAAGCSGISAPPPGTSGSTSGTLADCTATANVDEPDPEGIDANCDGIDGMWASAVFVATDGSDGGAGTMADPLATLPAAVAMAKTKGAVQVLVASGTYTEEAIVGLGDGIGIHGGYDADWQRPVDGPATLLEGPAVAVEGDGLTQRTALSRIEIHSADGTEPSESSIALRLMDCDEVALYDGVVLQAGDGADGTDGEPGAVGTGGGPGGIGGSGSADSQSSPGDGGTGGTNSTCGVTEGGLGGDGGQDPDFSGGSGLYSSGGIVGGPGGSTSGCSPAPGTDGTPAPNGQPGSNGAGGTAAGYFDASGELVLGNGMPGTDGTYARGGGGGGGSSGQTGFTCIDGAGNGGGGGGAGGCGGTAGTGGTPGGGSFALVALGSAVTLDDVLLSTGTGGEGGTGGRGGAGGAGGSGGRGGNSAAAEIGLAGSGGDGGDGGDGGHGGGGPGGPAIGLYTDAPEPDLSTTTVSVGTPGAGGTSLGNPGADGVAAEVVSTAR